MDEVLRKDKEIALGQTTQHLTSTLQGLTAIWVKFLIAITRVYQLVRSWELKTWSLKLNSIDILTASPHYFCKKCMETQKENL